MQGIAIAKQDISATAAPNAVHQGVRGRRWQPTRPSTSPVPSDLLTDRLSRREFTVKRRSLPIAAALATTAALLLTACGSGDDDTDRAVATPKASASPSAAPATENKPDGVDVSLPADMNLVFDWTKPKAKNEAAMEDATNYIRSIYQGVDKGTTKSAAVATYATGGGLKYANTQIDAYIEGGWTVTGTRRHSVRRERPVGRGGVLLRLDQVLRQGDQDQEGPHDRPQHHGLQLLQNHHGQAPRGYRPVAGVERVRRGEGGEVPLNLSPR
jgi:hypothetical protein